VNAAISHATHPTVNDPIAPADAIAVTTATPPAMTASLDDLAETIVAAQRAVEQMAGSLLSHAMLAGDALIQAKKQICHGQWGDFLRHRCDGTLSRRAKHPAHVGLGKPTPGEGRGGGLRATCGETLNKTGAVGAGFRQGA
jgi:hypothetical protein